jgi:hypothetical protein
MATDDAPWRHRAYVWLERTVLSAGMTALALAVEQVLVRAIKKGSVEPAARTAAGPDEVVVPAGAPDTREAQVSTASGANRSG